MDEPRTAARAIKEAWMASGYVMLSTDGGGAVRISDTQATQVILDLAGAARTEVAEPGARATRTRGEPPPIDLDGIEMRWASQWNESDDGEVRAWRDDVAALIDEVRRLRVVSNGYYEEMVRRGESLSDAGAVSSRAATAGRAPGDGLAEPGDGDRNGDIYPAGRGCSFCDGTGFVSDEDIERLRAAGHEVPWNEYPEPAATAGREPGPMTPDQEARQAFVARVYGAGWDAAKAEEEPETWPCVNCSTPLDACGVDLSVSRCCDDCDHPAATAGREPLDALRCDGCGLPIAPTGWYHTGLPAADMLDHFAQPRAALDTPDPGAP